MSAQFRGFRTLCLKYIVSSAIGTYCLFFGGTKGNGNSMQYLGVSWETTTNSKAKFLHQALGFLLKGLWLLEGALTGEIRDFNLQFICIFIYRLSCITCLWFQIVNSMIPYDPFRHPYCYFISLSFIYFPPLTRDPPFTISPIKFLVPCFFSLYYSPIF